MEFVYVVVLVVFFLVCALCVLQQAEIKKLNHLIDLYKDAYEHAYTSYMTTSKNYQLDIEKWTKQIEEYKNSLERLKDGNNRA